MARCRYKTWYLGEDWECPYDALLGEWYCYWHKEEDGKEPTEEQLEELKREKIFGVYLKEMNLKEPNLQKAFLCGANLQEARLFKANLQKAKLIDANLQETILVAANLQEADLSSANLQKANMGYAKLWKADLSEANLQETYLYRAELPETTLTWTNLQETCLFGANLQGAYLVAANLRGTNLSNANLQCATLYAARIDSKTDLDNTVFIGANLFRSYFDETKSFRNAKVFQNEEDDKEINEITGDCIGGWFIWILERVPKYVVNIVTKVLKKKPNRYLHIKPHVLDVKTIEKIEKNASSVAKKLQGKDLIRYTPEDRKIIFFDWQSGCAIKNPENGLWHKDNLVRIKELTDTILNDGKIQPEFLYKGSRADLYKASYEVYNNLYNFYIANGRLGPAAHVHYRRGEAHRKLRWTRGGWKNWTGLKYKMRSIFDLWILNYFTGYGDRILRPIFWSGVIIGVFAALFWHFDGIAKNVNGELATPDWVDYLYHSITTFTSLGYSNIQPNLAVGHLHQVLVAFESGLGVLMMALIIFVVTYQVSR